MQPEQHGAQRQSGLKYIGLKQLATLQNSKDAPLRSTRIGDNITDIFTIGDWAWKCRLGT